MSMGQPLYYVNGKSKFELGPFTKDELREALEQGDIDAQDQVRSDNGNALGLVSTVLKASGRQRTHSSTHKALEGEKRYTVITVAIIMVLLLLVACMVYALKSSAPAPIIAAPSSTDTAPAPVERKPNPVVVPVVVPHVGITPGTVATILARDDAIATVILTTAGGPNHISNFKGGEGANHVMDGTLDSKYYNSVFDGAHDPGVNDGFVITPSQGGIITAFQIATANDRPERDPVTITIEGSNDAHALEDLCSEFVVLYSGSTGLETDPARKQWGPSVVFDNARAYKSYRVLITKTRGRGDGMQLSEMRLGTLVPPKR